MLNKISSLMARNTIRFYKSITIEAFRMTFLKTERLFIKIVSGRTLPCFLAFSLKLIIFILTQPTKIFRKAFQA